MVMFKQANAGLQVYRTCNTGARANQTDRTAHENIILIWRKMGLIWWKQVGPVIIATCGSSNECVTWPTNQPTDTASYRGALSHLKMLWTDWWMNGWSNMARCKVACPRLRRESPVPFITRRWTVCATDGGHKTAHTQWYRHRYSMAIKRDWNT